MLPIETINGTKQIIYGNGFRDEETANKGGRVIEVLSEHTCQG
jgi:phosphoketolase